ncbi:MAG: transposase [Kosmotogaceae bacterium]
MGEKKRDVEEYRNWCKENFSGVLCIDEVRDSGRVILFATDSLNDFTIAWKVNTKNDQLSMDAFLEELKQWGLNPEVVITDGSPLYKDALNKHWKDVEHQLCIFHIIKDVNKIILDAVRSIKNKISRFGNRGRKRKRGRPRNNRKKKCNDKKKNLKQQAKFIWQNQHLIVKKKENLTKEDKKKLKEMFEIAPQLKLLRKFNRQFYKLFEQGISKKKAYRRWMRMMQNENYQNDNQIKKTLKMLRKEKFDKMITFMEYENLDRTNNHVERNNRTFRMMQKTRYKRRRAKTIETAIWLDVLRRWRKNLLQKASQNKIKLKKKAAIAKIPRAKRKGA